MLHDDKIELIDLLNEMSLLLPPVEKREALTWHYAKLEKRIEEAIGKIKDKDYQYITQVNAKLLELQLAGKLTYADYAKFAKIEPE